MSSASGFSASLVNAPSIGGSRFAMAATDNSTRCRDLRRLDTCSPRADPLALWTSSSWGLQLAGFRRQCLSHSELLAHFRQCLSQRLHRCHVRSAGQLNTIAPLPCCNVWMTKSFLDSSSAGCAHEKSYQVTNSDWSGDDTQTECPQEV